MKKEINELYFRLLSSESIALQQESYYAKWDWKPQNIGELTVEKGEVLLLIRKTNEEWWQMINKKGKKGYVPSSRLVKKT